MSKLINLINLSTIIFGIFCCFLTYNLFFNISLYRIKNEVGDVEKIYVINEEKAQKEIKNIEEESEDDDFSLINFIEKLNGDFTFEY